MSITKVKAHVKWQQLPDGRERRLAFFNAAADNEARKAVAVDCFEIWQKFDKKMWDAKKVYRKWVGRYHAFLCDIHERSFQVKPRVRAACVQPDFEYLWNPQGTPMQISGPLQSDIEKCPYGYTFACSAWWDKLQWFDGPATSALELHVDFCLESQSMAPVRLNKLGWKLREECVEADVTSQRLRLQCHAWIHMLKWWVRHVQTLGIEICRCNALYSFGPTISARGVSLRPRLLRGIQVSGGRCGNNCGTIYITEGQPKDETSTVLESQHGIDVSHCEWCKDPGPTSLLCLSSTQPQSGKTDQQDFFRRIETTNQIYHVPFYMAISTCPEYMSAQHPELRCQSP